MGWGGDGRGWDGMGWDGLGWNGIGWDFVPPMCGKINKSNAKVFIDGLAVTKCDNNDKRCIDNLYNANSNGIAEILNNLSCDISYIKHVWAFLES